MRLRSLPGRVARTLERALRQLRRIDEKVVRPNAAVDSPRDLPVDVRLHLERPAALRARRREETR